MRTLAALALALGVSIVACGGRVVATVDAGATTMCSSPGPACPLACNGERYPGTCVNGVWSCPPAPPCMVLQDATLPDVVVPGDDAGNDAGPNSCAPPTSLPGFAPIVVAPLQQAVCTQAAASQILNDCFGQAGAASACNADLAVVAYKTCFGCMLTNYSGTTMLGVTPPPPSAVSPWGPLIGIGIYVYPNVGACLALADPAYAACGQSMNALLQCQYEACDALCVPPIINGTLVDPTALPNCQAAAATGICLPYVNASNAACANVPDGGGVAAFCEDPNLFLDMTNLTEFVMQQCGIDESDAGGGG